MFAFTESSARPASCECHCLDAGLARRLRRHYCQWMSAVESLLAAEQRTLQMIARGASLAEVLDDLCRTIDAQAPGAISCILLMDPDGKRLWPGAADRVPSGFIQAIAPLTIGPRVGSCGTAAFLKERVIVSDIANDPLWSPFRDLALSYGFRAGWSQPIVSKDKQVLGTFGMYYKEPRVPTASELHLIEGAGHVALIALETERTHAALQQALAEIRKSEERLRLIIDTIPAQAWRGLPDGSADYFNQRWHDYTGLSPTEAHGWGWKAIIHPEDAARTMDKWTHEILPSGKPGEIETRLRRFDGEYRWFIVRVEPQRDELDQVIQWYGTNTDIDDLKSAEEKLRRDEQELRRITDAIPQTIIVLDTHGNVIYANQATLDYTGLTMEEVMATDFRARVFHPEDVERLRDERLSALSRGIPFENEQRARRKDGRYRWFLIRYHPLLDEQGNLLRWYATGTDIEDRKQVEERMRNENLALREEIDRSSMFEEIVGSSEVLRKVLVKVDRVAPTDSTVLIVGETGTGKELIARAVHKRSKRASRAFIRVDCAAIPPSLIASELFGHEKGAFTGALQKRLGRFESADGGTILLDEIGELPAETQPALLRVLQEREFERVGSSRPIAVDVRVLAATNRDLKSLVTRGAFRQDLFYRLNVFPIEIPPLRERVDDIPLLVEYLLERYAKRAGKRIRNIRKKTLELFQAYDWPGNIRELQNVVERAVILCDGETFSVEDTWLRGDSSQSGQSVSEAGAVTERKNVLVQQEKRMIEDALAASAGRISGPVGAAAKLGIPRQTLESKIRALRIDKQRFKTS
jgi:formate hydrogenlyase transcriptional activator